MKIKCVYFSLILSYRRNVRENAAVIQFSRRNSLSEPDTPTTQNCNYENPYVRDYQACTSVAGVKFSSPQMAATARDAFPGLFFLKVLLS